MIATGKRGSVYPIIKSDEESGDAKSLIKSDVLLSLAMSIPENKEIKEKPKTAMPGVSFSILNILTGILD